MINARACLDLALGEDLRVIFRSNRNRFSNMILPRNRLQYDDRGYCLKYGGRIFEGAVIDLSADSEGHLTLELDSDYITDKEQERLKILLNETEALRN